MLRIVFLTALGLLLLITFSFLPEPGLSQTTATTLLRITSTSEEVISLNPSISGAGRHLVFESSADLAGSGGTAFRTFLVNAESSGFKQIAATRSVAPAISDDGSRIAFASAEDLVGRNPDRNSEIFMFDAGELNQITDTKPADPATRLLDGSFQPSLNDDGSLIAFSSNRNIVGQNADENFEIFLFDVASSRFTQITTSTERSGSTNAKLSGDGTRIAYLNETNNGRQLMLHEYEANAVQTVASGLITLTYGRAISDDGQKLVYAAEQAENQTQVFLFDSHSGQARQITALGARVNDVPLNPTISGDGKRIAFATRRNVVGQNSDASVELYLYDLPSAEISKLTNAPSRATAEVIASLNDDGSMVVFNFPRILSEAVADNDHANNSEIYLLALAPRADLGNAVLMNGAALGNEPATVKRLAPESIAIARGSALATATIQAQRLDNGSFPFSLGGTTVTVGGRPAQLLYVSPAQVNFIVPRETNTGASEVIVTNSLGFPSISTGSIAPVAPGIFTRSGDGRGEGIILNADTLIAGPFDPTDNQLRLILFATGVRNASQVSISIAGQSLTSEAVLSSSDLPGLDEIHVHVPSDLRGARSVTLNVTADNVVSNSVALTFAGSARRDIMINEILADPPDGLSGDANGDGVRDSSHDEFVELVNTTSRDLDISGFQLMTRSPAATTDSLRHRFAAGTVFPAGTAIVIFGGGNPDATGTSFGNAQIFKASTGGLSLLNSGVIVTVGDASSIPINFVGYGGTTALRGDQNQSLTRSPDVDGSFVLHQMVVESGGRHFTPGTRVDSSPFLPQPAIAQISLSPQPTIMSIGEELQFVARAVDENNQELSEIIFGWQSTEVSVAAITSGGLVRALSSGTTQIRASARGVNSSPVSITVSAPSPSPSPDPTATPTPGPSPSPAPVPSPTVTPSPVPSPSATPTPLVVISEFRTRGPGGASDEFVELYNNSDAAVAIGGWKLRGSSSSGSVSNRMTIASGVIIPPRGHFLAVNSAGYSGIVSGDQSYTSGISNDGGIALTLPDDSVVDQVGLSPGSAFKEGMHLAPLVSDANQSYERRPGGPEGSTQDDNDNFVDFLLLTPSDPQNLSSTPTPGPNSTPSPTPQASPSPSPIPSPLPSPSPSPSPSPETALVISQIYGGGGNSGAPFRNDFIEIFNRGTTAVDLNGWSVQYAGATSATWSVTKITPVTLDPGQYYLIQEGSGGNNGANLPAPDVAGTIAMAAGAGKVTLVKTETALSGACPDSGNIVDLVGYGNTANCFGGTGSTPPPSNTNAIKRTNDGCIDTRNNSADFNVGPPDPRNTLSMKNQCQKIVMMKFYRGPAKWLDLRSILFGTNQMLAGWGLNNYFVDFVDRS